MPRCIPRSMQGGIASSALPDPLDAAGYSRGVTGDAAPSWWQRLGGPNAVSMPAWLLTLPFAVAAFLASAVDLSEQPDGPSVLLVLLVVPVGGQVVLGLVCSVMWLTLLRPAPRPSRPLVAVVTFMVAGLLRALWVHYSALVVFGFDDPRALVRLFSGTLVTVVLLAMAALIVDGYRRHRETRRSLLLQLRREEEFESRARAALHEYRTDLIADIERTVLTEVESVAGHVGDGQAIPDRLAGVTRQVLQPLTLSLRADATPLTVPERHRESAGQLVLGTLRGILAARPFTPGPSALLAGVLLGATVTSIWGPSIALGSAVIFAAVLGLGLALARRFVAPRLPRWPVPVAAAVTVVVWLIIAGAGVAITLVVFREEAFTPLARVDPEVITLRGMVFALGAIVSPAVVHGVARQWQQDDERLRASVEVVARKTAALQLEAWAERQQLGARIHGRVQAEVVAAALRLSSDPDLDPTPVLEDLQGRISVALVEGTTSDWRALMDDVRTVWGLSIELTMAVSGSAAAALDERPASAQAVVEIVREGITNAVRAGRADRVSVEVSCTDGVLRVLVADDGSGVTGDEPRGAGSRMLDDVCLRWSRRSAGGGTELDAHVAMTESSPNSPQGANVPTSGVST